jgi:hypothetical protein
MAIFGDRYSYRIDVDLNGIRNVDDLNRAMDRLRRAQELVALRFQKGRIDAEAARKATARYAERLTELESVSKRVAVAKGGMNAASNRAAQSLTQLTFVVDDAQYGMRGLMNQLPMIATGLFGFGPAGAAAGLAFTILAGVFRENIDEMLAWAGVLDENVVKGLDKAEKKAKEKAELFREHLDALTEAFSDAPKPTKEMAANVSQVFDDAGRAATDGIVAVLDAADNPRAQAAFEQARKAIQDRLRELTEASDAIIARGGDDSFLIGQFIGLDRQLKKLEEGNKARIEASRKRLEALQKAAIGGDRAAIDRLAELSKQAGFAGLATDIKDVTDRLKEAEAESDEFADAILQHEKDIAKAQTDRWKAGEEAREQEVQDQLELMRLEHEREQQRQARVAQRRIDEAQARALERLDEDTKRAVETFGPQLQGMIAEHFQVALRLGASPEQARTGAFRGASDRLERVFGVGRDVAAGAASHLVEQQFGPMQAAVDANNAAVQFARMSLQNSGFFLNALEQSRAQFLQMIRELEVQRQRVRRNDRRMAPLRFMHGNAVNGRF